MEFDPRKVNGYSLEELLDFVQRGEVTFADLQKCGLRRDKMDLVEDSHWWLYSRNADTISAYKFYLDTVGDNALHTSEAKKRIEELEIISPQLYDDLLDDMREDLMKYKANVLSYLFGKMPPPDAWEKENSPIGRFLKAKLKLTFEDLYRGGILPKGNRTLERAIFKDDFEVPQLPMEEIGELPAKRTDVYFFGLPASGQSCVLAGTLNYLHIMGEGQYVSYLNSKNMDPCRPYYDAIVKGLSECKAPRSTARDTVSFIQFDLGPMHDQKVTFVEHGDEPFMEISRANTDRKEILEQFGVYRCLKSPNPKVLFFLLDYSSIIGKNPAFSNIDQTQVLEKALAVLSSDGEGPNGEKNCTMSKVSTVTVVVTKSDLMDVEVGRVLTQEERADIAFDYLNRYFGNFFNELAILCKKYGINAHNKDHACVPFITTFSLGQFYLGNSVIYDSTDSKCIADFIVAATGKKHKGILDFLK